MYKVGNIYIHNENNPESNAFIQALNSRSDKGFLQHRDIVAGRDSKEFFNTYYLGYGHKSIGDCGSTTIYIEDIPTTVSMAIQHSRLYNGQELSTRYIDRSNAKIYNPYKDHKDKKLSNKVKNIINTWMDLYADIRKQLIDVLPGFYPKDDNISNSTYNRAIHAYAVDIARYFLPIGIHTNISWYTTLSHADDYTRLLIHHPDPVVSNTAMDIRLKLYNLYPSTFKRVKIDKDTMDLVRDYFYFDDRLDILSGHMMYTNLKLHSTLLSNYSNNVTVITEQVQKLNTRDRRDRYPIDLYSDVVNYSIIAKIDYGILRDIHRHRAMNVKYKIDLDNGFELRIMDYINKYLDYKVYEYILDTIYKQYFLLTTIEDFVHYDKVYLYPFGHKVNLHINTHIMPLIYFMELRSNPSVHFMLREFIYNLYRKFKSDTNNPYKDVNVNLHPDIELSGLYINRGKQTIVKRNEV